MMVTATGRGHADGVVVLRRKVMMLKRSSLLLLSHVKGKTRVRASGIGAMNKLHNSESDALAFPCCIGESILGPSRVDAVKKMGSHMKSSE